MTFIMQQQILATELEKVINTALSLNLGDNNQLSILVNKTLEIHLSELGFPLCFTAQQANVLVTGITERSDCKLTTSISSLLELQNFLKVQQTVLMMDCSHCAWQRL